MIKRYDTTINKWITGYWINTQFIIVSIDSV